MVCSALQWLSNLIVSTDCLGKPKYNAKVFDFIKNYPPPTASNVVTLRRLATALQSVVATALLLCIFAAPLAAVAQTTPTIVKLVSNTGETLYSNSQTRSWDYDQGFRTGNHTEGYKLTQVDLQIQGTSGTADPPTYSVEIWSEVSGALGTRLATLTAPATLADGTNSYTVSGQGLDLTANTRYHFVWDTTAGGNSKRNLTLETTDTGNEDSGSAAGWTIDDVYNIRSWNGSSWSDSVAALKIAIHGYAKPPPDTTAPTVSTATVDGVTLTLTYDEALDTSSVPAANSFTVTVAGSSRNLAGTNPVAVAGSAVTLTLATAVTPGQTVTVSYTVPGTNPIQDAASNAVAALTNQSVTNNTPDTTAPSLSTATVNGTTLTLTYSEALDTSSVPAANSFTVTVAGSSRNLAATNPVAVSGSTVTLTLATAVTPGQTVTVSYTVPGTNPIQDAASNAAAALTNQSVTNNTVDTTAPSLSTATVNGTTLTLTYSEALDTNSVPAASAFTVKVANATVSLASSNPVAVSGSTVTLTLAGTVSLGASVTVSYAAPSSNPIQDEAGNASNSFIDQTVDSGTALSSNAALSNLSVTDAANAMLSLDQTFSSGTAAYSITVEGGTTSVTVTATVSHQAATLSGSLTKAGGTAETVAMTSGMMTTLSDLATGNNVLTIQVTAEDGTTRTYTLSIMVSVMVSTDDSPMRPQALKKVLATAGRQSLQSALGNVGARLGDVAPATNLTLAGQMFGGLVTNLTDTPCQTDAFTRPDDCGFQSQGLSMSELLGSSGFSLILGATDGNTVDSASPNWSFWGRGDLSSFAGRPDGTKYNGESGTLWLGADARTDSWVAGIAVSRGESETDYSYDMEGESGSGYLETDLTAIYPYGRLALANGVELQGLVGAGTGEVRHRLGDTTSDEKSDISVSMASTRLSKNLSFFGFSVVAQGDLSLVQMKTGSGAQAIDGLKADSWQMRASVKSSRSWSTGGAGEFKPTAEAGLRLDGGDAETGFGLDISAGLDWRNTSSGMSANLRVHSLMVHESDGIRERGVSGTVGWRPDPSAMGPSLTLNYAVGGSTTGGVDALLKPDTLSALETIENSLNNHRMEIRLGYGLPVLSGRFIATPKTTFGFSDNQRDVSLGWWMKLVDRSSVRGTGSVELSVEARRSESAGNSYQPSDKIVFQLRTRF